MMLFYQRKHVRALNSWLLREHTQLDQHLLIYVHDVNTTAHHQTNIITNTAR